MHIMEEKKLSCIDCGTQNCKFKTRTYPEFCLTTNLSEEDSRWAKNAMALVNKNAAIYIADTKAKDELVAKAIETVRNDALLMSLEENIEKMGRPNAAEEIANEVMILADAYIEKETRRKKENLK